MRFVHILITKLLQSLKLSDIKGSVKKNRVLLGKSQKLVNPPTLPQITPVFFYDFPYIMPSEIEVAPKERTNVMYQTKHKYFLDASLAPTL